MDLHIDDCLDIQSIDALHPSKQRRKKKDPLEITSDRMRSEDGGIKIIFMGNVVGYWGDLKITSDILEIYNTEDKKETEEIIAIGNVFITRGLKRGKGDKAIYICLLYTSPSPRDATLSRMPSSA